MLTVSCAPTASSTSGMVAFRNPGCSAVSRYVPIANPGNPKIPDSFVCATVLTPVPVFTAVTTAFPTCAPDGSVTVPDTVASVCANDTAANDTNATITLFEKQLTDYLQRGTP